MADSTNLRLAITVEIRALSSQQIKAVQDATFMGWETGQTQAYEERSKRISALRTELFHLESTLPD